MQEKSIQHKLIMTTIGTEQQALALAEQLINQKLAACVNILPKMQSIYRWQGKLERGEEHLLLIKTLASHVEAVFEAVRADHPYELPEIIVVPIEDGYEPYINWITTSVDPL